MKFELRTLAKILLDSGAKVHISCGEEALERVMKERCWQALREIRDVLDDEELDDPICFRRIERIVEIYEAMGLGGGSPIDF